MQKWRKFVKKFSEAFEYGRQISFGSGVCQLNVKRALSLQTVSDAEPPKKGSRVMLCSPHPDDECLTGALPLRLLKESNATVLNLAITLGSASERKKERLQELTRACAVMGFTNLLVEEPLGFSAISLRERRDSREEWFKKVSAIAGHFQQFSPDLVCMPHRHDGHPTHEAVSLLVSDALRYYSRESCRQILVAESEFWHPLNSPKLLIGINDEDVALLVAGMAEHKGETIRNPYHLRQPARLMDNVRRGGELICGAGVELPKFCFGELYDLCLYESGERGGASGEMIFPPGVPIDFL